MLTLIMVLVFLFADNFVNEQNYPAA